MARKRLISPEFFQHGPLYDAEQASGLPLRLAFAGLWCQADREGRFRLRPRELKLGVLPYDNVDFGAVLSALQTYGFIKAYVVDGESFAYIPSFHRWQTFHTKEGASTVPAPCETGASNEKGGASTAITVTVTGTVSSTGTVVPPSSVPDLPAVVRTNRPRPVKPAPRPDTWLTSYAVAWDAKLGAKSFPFGQGAKYLKPVDDAIGAVEGPNRLRRYLEATEAKFVSLARFAATHGAYAEGASQSPYEILAQEAADVSAYLV